jgi:hypothetical protein
MDQISDTAAGLVDKRLRLMAIESTNQMDFIDLWGPTCHYLGLIISDFSVDQDYD